MAIVIGFTVVRSTFKYGTVYRQEEGTLVRPFGGEVVPEEKEYFRLSELPWIEPQRPTVAALRRVQKG